MPFQLSPGVAVVEKDFSAIIPAVSTSAGAFAGAFTWGPVLDPVTISSETVLVQRFGKPTDANAQSFFTAANFLAYTNNLLTVRADAAGHRNAVATLTGSVSAFVVDQAGDSYASVPHVTIGAPNVSGGVQATAHVVLSGGGVDHIVVDNPGTGYTAAPSVSIAASSGTRATAHAQISQGGIKINNFDVYTNSYVHGEGVVGEFAAKYPGALGNSLEISIADQTTYTGWEYAAEFDSTPTTSTYAAAVGGSNDELHVVVVDADGLWSGTAGTVLEKYAFVSKASDGKKSDGTNNYYKDVINSQSKYIWWMDHTTSVLTTVNGQGTSGVAWGTAAAGVGFKDLSAVVTKTLVGGVDDLNVTDGAKMTAYDIFANAELYDISLIPLGKASTTVATHVVNNVAEARLDCVVFISPEDVADASPIIGSGSDAANKILAYRVATNLSSSYAVLDSGYKYQYDKYNDKYRYVPLNGDVAGLSARTDYTNDPWWSPAGLNRGQIKNVVKLAFNPGKTERDNLYKGGVNPVVNFPGQGTVLFGDKTLLAKPSAFDRINVRRLFIVLEKAIATAAKYQLFEFNDSFTRAQFKNLVEPFLRDVQGRRGVTDFRVKCDDTNNTGEVIDRNEFVADIYIKPNRSINFITLNFIAARTSVAFSEIGA
jgi:Phage tail sheath protein subtilisin-like domain/Phage tail sheath C-terminal domain